MIKIEIVATVAHERLVSPKNGRPAFTVNEQDAYAYTLDRNGNAEQHPQKIILNLERGQTPYPPGFYTILPESLYVGKFSQLEIGRLRLKQLAVEQPKRQQG